MDRISRLSPRLLTTLCGALLAVGCSESKPPPKPDLEFRERLRDPDSCKDCHPIHYREWAGSMHAYAADDPVFLAMNRRGQRETNGALGDFCVKCHAPLAVKYGLTKDGLNLDELPRWSKGVNCYTCHQVEAIEGTHNNPLRLADDDVMRGGVKDPAPAVRNRNDPRPFHASAYSELHDGGGKDSDGMKSAPLCGSCHDIVNPGGTHLERTFFEWTHSIYNAPYAGNSCVSCHMRADDQPIATSPGAKARIKGHHKHHFVGPDRALTIFPDAARDAEYRAEQEREREAFRANALCASLCLVPPEFKSDPKDPRPEVSLWIHNEQAGHSWPSGASADRRAWIELRSTGVDPSKTFASGVVDPKIAATEVAKKDPNMWLFHDRWYNAAGKETHMFWEVTKVEPNTLPVNDFNADANFEKTTWRERRYKLDGFSSNEEVATVQSRMRFRAMGLEIIDDLIASGDLDPSFRDQFEIDTMVSASLDWPNSPTPIYSDTGYGRCVATSKTCQSPFICSTPKRGCTQPMSVQPPTPPAANKP